MKSFDQGKSRKSIKNQKVKSLTFILRKFSKCFSLVFSKLWKGITQNFTYKLKKTSNMKHYLQEPPILMPQVPGRPLLMYLTVLEGSMGCVLGQHDESGRKECAIYYLSKKFI